MTLSVTQTLQQILSGPPSPTSLEASLRYLAKWRAELVANTFAARQGRVVASGPFKGMAYVVKRFAATHKVTEIGRRLDDTGLPGWMEELSDLDRLIALWEWRAGPTPWLWMEKQ
ncbi:hypothetical protein [Tabrizicola oligotrophica]|uniref:Uncharacterized protein n=1 Tax=Tabrizicola oligotrophica TaxID=2710650 RepID=A0A6M0QV02_9RHOB|nr:hypothetical protein [Tabrizicola oligotrophica]NEY91316.1 hypothetical protein [Tabrizicola oligotrophica]